MVVVFGTVVRPSAYEFERWYGSIWSARGQSRNSLFGVFTFAIAGSPLNDPNEWFCTVMKQNPSEVPVLYGNVYFHNYGRHHNTQSAPVALGERFELIELVS